MEAAPVSYICSPKGCKAVDGGNAPGQPPRTPLHPDGVQDMGGRLPRALPPAMTLEPFGLEAPRLFVAVGLVGRPSTDRAKPRSVARVGSTS
jgi:hypothetical protein